MSNKPILKFLFFSLIVIYSSYDIIGQNYTCSWNSRRDHFFLDGGGSMPERYRENYKLKARDRRNQDSYKAFRKIAREIEPLLNKKYHSIKYIVNNRIVVRDNYAKLGIVDNYGKTVLEPDYIEVFLFINQEGWLLKKGWNWILVDSNFQEIMEDKFEHVMIISDDHFLAKKKDSDDLYLCHSGKGIIKNFGNVCFQAGYVGNPTYIIIRDGEEKSLYNTNGEKIYNLVSGDRIKLVEKRFADNDTPAFTINRDRKFGLVAADASYHIPIKYKRINDISNDLNTYDYFFECNDGKNRVLYKNGDSILVSDNLIFSSIRRKLGPYQKTEDQKSNYLIYSYNDKKGFYNINTGFVSKPKYENIAHCTRSTLMVSKNGFLGVIDSLDNEILPPEFSRLAANVNSIIGLKDSTYAIYDLSGEIIMPADYEFIAHLEKDKFGSLIRATFTKNGKKGFYDETYKEIIPPIYDAAKNFSSGLAAVLIDRKWGFIDPDGKLIIPAIYDKVASFEEEIAKVSLNGRLISVNKNGDCIKNCE